MCETFKMRKGLALLDIKLIMSRGLFDLLGVKDMQGMRIIKHKHLFK